MIKTGKQFIAFLILLDVSVWGLSFWWFFLPDRFLISVTVANLIVVIANSLATIFITLRR
jgi:hypothetical protein